MQSFPDPEEFQDGPWGGKGDNDADYRRGEEPRRLLSVTIHSGFVVDAFQYTYVDQIGEEHTIGRVDGTGGHKDVVSFFPHSIQQYVLVLSMFTARKSLKHHISKCIFNCLVQITLGASDYIKSISGTTDRVNGRKVITSLTFFSNNDKIYGPFGRGGGEDFTSEKVPKNGRITGFFATYSKFLDSLGVYYA
jgi:hypothetical protein